MPGDEDSVGQPPGRISRRDLIRRGAVLAGASAWAIPVIHRLGPAPARTTVDAGAPLQEGEVVVAQQLSSTCEGAAVCPADVCGEVLLCGESDGIFSCFCAAASGGGCGCFAEIFCEEGTPCDPNDPNACPGGACYQGCCDTPICIPACGSEVVVLAVRQTGEASGTRLTVTGRRL